MKDTSCEKLPPDCLVIVFRGLEVVSCDSQELFSNGLILRCHLVRDRLKETTKGGSVVTLLEEEIAAVARTYLLSD